MNQRITELAAKANATANDVVIFGGENYAGLRDDIFAELIVKECLKEIKDMIVDESELLYPNNKQTTEFVNDRLLDAYDNIKEHFGVKE
jgi:hypothetical protein